MLFDKNKFCEILIGVNALVAQLVEREFSKLQVAGSYTVKCSDECSSVVDQGTSMMVKDTVKVTMDA